MSIRILLADDHKMFLEGLEALLKGCSDIEVVATLHNGQQVLEAMQNTRVDVVLTDMDMPLMDGMKLSRELRKLYPQVKVLALTMHNEPRIISGMLKAGVQGYVLKDASRDELLKAVRSVAAGQEHFSPEVKEALLKGLQQGKGKGGLIELSEREQEVVRYIAAGLTQAQIAEKLFISEHTVIFHKRKLFSKFDVNNTAGLIKCAMEQGFLS